MGKNDRAVYVMMLILAIAVLGGFFFTFDRIGEIRTQMKNLELEVEFMKARGTTTPTTSPAEPPAAAPPPAATLPPPSGTDLTIPATIIFKTQSNPILQPQTEITITVDSVSMSADGMVTVNIKAYANEATSYAAITPGNYFELIDLQGENQRPLFVNGQFNSIPPRGAATGSVVFKTSPTKSTIILQIGESPETARFYEFNFVKKTYKETVLG